MLRFFPYTLEFNRGSEQIRVRSRADEMQIVAVDFVD